MKKYVLGILVLFIGSSVWTMEEQEKLGKAKLRFTTISQGITTVKPTHRRTKSENYNDSFVNKDLVSLAQDPIQDAQEALLEGKTMAYQAAFQKINDEGVKNNLRHQWNRMRRNLYANHFKTDNHSNGSRIMFIRGIPDKPDTP